MGVPGSEARRRAVLCRRRPTLRRIEADPRLLVEVNRGLALRGSPQQISPKLRMDFPDDAAMRVSHEAIDQALFVPAQGQLQGGWSGACAAAASAASA